MPRPETGPLVLWRLGGALLAVDLDVVDEVVGVDAAGRARARTGPLDLVAPPGLTLPPSSRQAVVVRGRGVDAEGKRQGEGTPQLRLALAADQVEGVYGVGEAAFVAPPEWLGRLDTRHLASLVQLDNGRLAAALDVGALFRMA